MRRTPRAGGSPREEEWVRVGYSCIVMNQRSNIMNIINRLFSLLAILVSGLLFVLKYWIATSGAQPVYSTLVDFLVGICGGVLASQVYQGWNDHQEKLRFKLFDAVSGTFKDKREEKCIGKGPFTIEVEHCSRGTFRITGVMHTKHLNGNRNVEGHYSVAFEAHVKVSNAAIVVGTGTYYLKGMTWYDDRIDVGECWLILSLKDDNKIETDCFLLSFFNKSWIDRLKSKDPPETMYQISFIRSNPPQPSNKKPRQAGQRRLVFHLRRIGLLQIKQFFGQI
jgi:hypothetical protein